MKHQQPIVPPSQIRQLISFHPRLTSSPDLDFPLCCPTYSCPDDEEAHNASQDDHHRGHHRGIDDDEEARDATQNLNLGRGDNEEARP